MNRRPWKEPEPQSLEATKFDRVIEETLAALSSAEAPPGLDQRILHTLAQRMHLSTRVPGIRSRLAGSHRWRLLGSLQWPGLAGMSTGRTQLLTACAFVLAVLFTAALHRRHAIAGTAMMSVPPALIAVPASRIPSPPLHSSRKLASSRQLPVLSPIQRRKFTPYAPVYLPARRAILTIPAVSSRSKTPLIPGVTRTATLSTQERLLQQIARSGDPGQIAMLNPEVLARQQIDRAAEFWQFFAPSVIPNP